MKLKQEPGIYNDGTDKLEVECFSVLVEDRFDLQDWLRDNQFDIYYSSFRDTRWYVNILAKTKKQRQNLTLLKLKWTFE